MTFPTTIDENAPVVVDHTIRIAAPLERVWQLHTDIGRWPAWQPAIVQARLDGPIVPGTTFHWVTAGLSIDSTVYAVDEARHRLLWGGPAHGITGVHEWTFAKDGDGVVVRTRESWAGDPVEADRDTLAAALDDSLHSWLDALKKTAELAMPTGDAVADDVGVGLRAEAADHEHGDARELEPAGQLLSEGRCHVVGGGVR